MRLKNQRAALVLSALCTALLLGGLALYRWWATGATPPAPATFFDAAQVDRALERLAASRLDHRPLIALTTSVQAHVQRAESVSFTNPEAVLPAILDLEQDLARLSVAYERLLEETAGAGAPDWQQRFRQFERDTQYAYRDAREWAHALTAAHPDRLGFRALLDLVITAKDTSASLQAFPPWRQREELARLHYPAFEQAYRLRGEQDSSIIEARLLERNPGLLRWFYARLYEALLPLPASFCPDALHKEASRLTGLSREVAASDPLEQLADWPFLSHRAGNLLRLADLVSPLETALSLALWLEEWQRIEPAYRALQNEARPPGPRPDPFFQTRLNDLPWLAHNVLLAHRRALEADHPDAWIAFARFVARTYDESTDAWQCLLTPMLRLQESHARWIDREQAFRAYRLAEDSPSISRVFSELHAAAHSLSEALGTSVTERFVDPAFDAWLAQRWPGWETAPQLADALRELVTRGLLPDPRLAALAAFLEEVAPSDSSQSVRAHMQRWHEHLRADLADYPRLQLRLDAALTAYRDQWVLTEIEGFLDAGREADLRLYLEELGAGVPGDLRALSDAALAMLRMQDRVGDLVLDDLARFLDRNTDLLPAAPPPDSVLYPLYEKQILPLLDLAELTERLPTLSPSAILAQLDRAHELRQQIMNLYSGWTGFDDSVARAVLASSPALIALHAESLRSSARHVARLLAWEGIVPATRTALLDLQRLLAACVLFLEEDPCAPGVSDWVSESRAIRNRLRLEDADLDHLLHIAATAAEFCHNVEQAPTSFRRLADLYREAHAAIVPVLIQHEIEASGIARRLRSTQAALERLQPIVELDVATFHGAGTDPEELRALAESYRHFAQAPENPARLIAYARAQADWIEDTMDLRSRTVTPAAPSDPALRIDRSRLRDAPATFGYGERWARRGESASLWMESAGVRARLLQGAWKEIDRQIQITVSEVVPGTVQTGWGQTITFGISIAHSRTGERTLVPDDGRSRWNPLNYGLYAVQTNDYVLATYPSLHALLRELHVAGRTDETWIRLDPLLRESEDGGDSALWQVSIHDLPPGRDLDWPEVFVPLTPSEAGALGRELRGALEEWLQDGALPLLEP